MNILVFSWRDPKHPLAGGAEQVMHEHLKGWFQAGHKVTLFSSRVKELPEKETLDGIEIIRKGDQYFGVKIAGFLYYLKNRRKIDFVVDQFHGIPFFTPLYIKKPKLAVLQEITREVWFLYHLMPFPFNYLLGLLGYLSEPLVFLFYRRTPFMVGSNSAKEDLIKMRIPAKNITIVSHGVIVYQPKPFPDKEKIKTITFLGALAKDKGIEDALKTFSVLAKKGNYQFWVIGRGSPDYKDYLASICKELGIIKKVNFWGYVSQKKKFELLARTHLLINPSIREGWGLVNIEANSVGVPVVAYSSQGLVDSVWDGKSGIIIKGNSFKGLVDAILDILDNEEKYKDLSKGALLWSRNFSWAKSRRKSLELINRISKGD